MLRASLPIIRGEAVSAQIAICVRSSSRETHGEPSGLVAPMRSMSGSFQCPGRATGSSASEYSPQCSMIDESEPHEHWMSSQLRQRLHPAAIIWSKGLADSLPPRYAGHEHEYTIGRESARSALPKAA